MRYGVWMVLALSWQAAGQAALTPGVDEMTRELRRHDPYARVMTVEEWQARYGGGGSAVAAEILPGKFRTGYIRIASFFPSSVCREFREALIKFKAARVGRLVVDIRGNPGGQRMSAVCVAGLLLGRKVVAGYQTIKPTIPNLTDWAEQPSLEESSEITWVPSVTEQHFAGPVALLMSRSSASAAEIVAAAWRDHQRAWLIGGRTHGKGMAQEYLPVKNRPGLVIGYSFEKFYSPKGESPEGRGVRVTFLPDKIGSCVADKKWVNKDDFMLAMALAVLDCAGNEPVPAHDPR